MQKSPVKGRDQTRLTVGVRLNRGDEPPVLRCAFAVHFLEQPYYNMHYSIGCIQLGQLPIFDEEVGNAAELTEVVGNQC